MAPAETTNQASWFRSLDDPVPAREPAIPLMPTAADIIDPTLGNNLIARVQALTISNSHVDELAGPEPLTPSHTG